MKKVITYGTFDVLHKGHINLLRRAKELGDYLIVGVTSDSFDRERGKFNVHDSVSERIESVRKTGYADEIIVEDHVGQKLEDIRKYNVDIFVLGSDWEGKFDYLKEYCEVVYLPRTENISSTILRANMVGGNDKLFESSLKSTEVEGWFNVNIGRPAGFFFAKGFAKLGVHPNIVSVLSILAGICSSFFFFHGSFHYKGITGLIFNIIAALFMYLCIVFDDSDGQLARMTGKTSTTGRILDGASSLIFYPFIYWMLVFRIIKYHSIEFSLFGIPPTRQNIILFAIAVVVLALFSGYVCFASQMRRTDYYIQAHLFFQKNGNREFEESSDLQKEYDSLDWKKDFWRKLCKKLYMNYTKDQERATPKFQKFKTVIRDRFGSLENIPESLRLRFLDCSRPLMKYVILLSGPFRTHMLVIFCLLDIPFGYFIFEITVFSSICRIMVRKHEKFCSRLAGEIESNL